MMSFHYRVFKSAGCGTCRLMPKQKLYFAPNGYIKKTVQCKSIGKIAFKNRIIFSAFTVPLIDLNHL